MNILFISNLTGKLWAGPNYSVPAQVLAQSRIDNVMWINLNRTCLPQWRRREYIFLNEDDIKNFTVDQLPAPFNTPDFIIFEEVYSISPFNQMVRSILKSGIPYSVVPRCSLTGLAQRRHKFKKVIGNKLFYNKFLKSSRFIQYLTVNEKEESLTTICHPSIVIPNGTYLPKSNKKLREDAGIKASYIGRLEMDQKGLDLLINAISTIKEKLRSTNFKMNFYGPNIDNTVEKLRNLVRINQLDDIVYIHDGVFGDEKSKVLESSDIFIMTSRYEGMPMGLIEALSYGLPCIATKGTYLMDEIIQFNAGWPAGSDIEGIKGAILNMISDSQLLEIKSKNAKILAGQFTWDNLANILHKKIEETLINN